MPEILYLVAKLMFIIFAVTFSLICWFLVLAAKRLVEELSKIEKQVRKSLVAKHPFQANLILKRSIKVLIQYFLLSSLSWLRPFNKESLNRSFNFAYKVINVLLTGIELKKMFGANNPTNKG